MLFQFSGEREKESFIRVRMERLVMPIGDPLNGSYTHDGSL